MFIRFIKEPKITKTRFLRWYNRMISTALNLYRITLLKKNLVIFGQVVFESTYLKHSSIYFYTYCTLRT